MIRIFFNILKNLDPEVAHKLTINALKLPNPFIKSSNEYNDLKIFLAMIGENFDYIRNYIDNLPNGNGEHQLLKCEVLKFMNFSYIRGLCGERYVNYFFFKFWVIFNIICHFLVPLNYMVRFASCVATR